MAIRRRRLLCWDCICREAGCRLELIKEKSRRTGDWREDRTRMGEHKRPPSGLALLLFLSVVGPVLPDTLLLKDGTRVTGRFVSVDERGYLFESQGKMKTFPLADVAKLLIEPNTSGNHFIKEPVAKEAAAASWVRIL